MTHASPESAVEIGPLPCPHPTGPAGQDGARCLSIVVPVMDEEDAVGPFLTAMAPVLAGVRGQLGPAGATEIVFVDDGSRDATVARILETPVAGTAIRVVKLSRNFGKDVALSAGLRAARGDAVVPMDVDLQDPPEMLSPMVAAWLAGARVVNAVRTDRAADGWFRRHSAGAFYTLFNRLSSYPIHPNVGDFRLLDRSVVDAVNAMPERVRFMKGLFSWVGFSPVDIPYQRPARQAGETKWRFWSLWNFALDGITGSTTLPLRIWSYAGGALAVLSLLYAAYIAIRTLVFGVDLPGYASLMVALLTLSAVNLIALGVIGEYVGRIAVEVRQRPLYLVDEVLEAGGSNAPAPRTESGGD